MEFSLYTVVEAQRNRKTPLVLFSLELMTLIRVMILMELAMKEKVLVALRALAVLKAPPVPKVLMEQIQVPVKKAIALMP